MNNRYIQDEHQRQKYQNEERKKTEPFYGLGSHFNYFIVYPPNL